jgi:two-component system, OmpR family, response regulator
MVTAATSHIPAMALTVFIAEDNKPAVDSLVELLAALGGIEVVGTAHSEMAAVDWLLHHPQTCDLLITDLLLLPGGSGFGIIQHARSLDACKHVAVFSNFLTPAVGRTCRKLGADAVFLKSELDQLLDYVRSLQAGAAGADVSPRSS